MFYDTRHLFDVSRILHKLHLCFCDQSLLSESDLHNGTHCSWFISSVATVNSNHQYAKNIQP